MLQLEVEAQPVPQETTMSHWKTTQRGKGKKNKKNKIKNQEQEKPTRRRSRMKNKKKTDKEQQHTIFLFFADQAPGVFISKKQSQNVSICCLSWDPYHWQRPPQIAIVYADSFFWLLRIVTTVAVIVPQPCMQTQSVQGKRYVFAVRCLRARSATKSPVKRSGLPHAC